MNSLADPAVEIFRMDEMRPQASAPQKIDAFVCAALITGSLCFYQPLWDTCIMQTRPDTATEVFRMLGFASPEKVNLNRYQYGIVRSHDLVRSGETRANYGDVHYYKKAIEDGEVHMHL